MKQLILAELYENMPLKSNGISPIYNNIVNIFRNILCFFSDMMSSTINLPRTFKNYMAQFRIYLSHQDIKFQNIVKTNIELEKYHLKTGYIKDAIIRFKIAQFFFDRDNPEIHYWLGWCYFLQGKYDKAVKSLKKGNKSDEVKLAKFLENIDSETEIPRQIFEDLREITQCEGNKKYYSKDLYSNNIELPMEYMEFFLSSIEKLTHKPKILDYGCGSGLAGSYLDYQLLLG